jgi:hypothetical protein
MVNLLCLQRLPQNFHAATTGLTEQAEVDLVHATPLVDYHDDDIGAMGGE